MKPLTDNMQPTPLEGLGYKDSVEDLLRISDIDINSLKDESGFGLLVFPNSFEQDEQDIGQQSIIHLNTANRTLSTGNIMGFVGVNNTNLTIKSRFAKDDNEDYFLHYMLMRVFNINLFDLKHTTASDAVFDFLMYMFPFFLKKALRQGLYKSYIRNEYNDSNVKGRINVNRHIRQNIPFVGSIAYETREFSYDNNITQLVRHTIEYVKGTVAGQSVLRYDADTAECVSIICNATPTYSKNQRHSVMMRNVRPVNHPYFSEYTALQKICMRILRHESIKYGSEKDKVYGVLFDGAWLWEEYLNTIFSRSQLNITHAKNKTGENGINLYVGSKKYYPDFYKKVQGDTTGEKSFVIDAKYKRLGYDITTDAQVPYSATNSVSIGRDDLFQMITYMHVLPAKSCALVYPLERRDSKSQEPIMSDKHILLGYGGEIIGLGIPIVKWGEKDFLGFCKSQKGIEDKVIDSICEWLNTKQ